ncbi:MAG: glycosyl transferase family 2 [Rhodoferax sp.]|nr:glycosyl transferase family 2 [Rhodoferax sp.]
MAESKLSLSIIIPTYNSESTITECLKSIVNQNNKPSEVLIIDNVSTDNTLSIVKQYAILYPFIKIISQPDKSLYDAMNKGIILAKETWLYFIGSDDILYDNDVLKNINKQLQNTRQLVVYGNVLMDGDSGWANKGEVYDGEFGIPKLFKKNIHHQAIFYNRDVFGNAGNYNTAYKICADYDLNLKLASKYKFHYVNLIIARFNAGGISTHNIDDRFNSDFNINILQYYAGRLLAKYMEPFSFFMVNFGKQKLKKGKLFGGAWFILAGYYHKLRKKLL